MLMKSTTVSICVSSYLSFFRKSVGSQVKEWVRKREIFRQAEQQRPWLHEPVTWMELDRPLTTRKWSIFLPPSIAQLLRQQINTNHHTIQVLLWIKIGKTIAKINNWNSICIATEAEKVKEERVQGMFNYLNGTTSAAEHHRQQQQHSNGNRPTRSSSGSGGDSDECRSNRATRNSDTPSPGNPTTDGSSPTDMDNSSHSGGSNHSSSRSGTSSQLRQMLLASNGESIMTTTSSRTKSCSSSSSSSRSNTTQHSNTDDSNNMYKFKTNIHQRFTADLEHVFPQSSCLMTPSSTSSLPEQNHHSQQAMERSFEQQSKSQF